MKIDPDAPGTVPGVNHRGWRDVPIRVTKGWNLYVDCKLNGQAGAAHDRHRRVSRR